jgi:hypothetical protein
VIIFGMVYLGIVEGTDNRKGMSKLKETLKKVVESTKRIERNVERCKQHPGSTVPAHIYERDVVYLLTALASAAEFLPACIAEDGCPELAEICGCDTCTEARRGKEVSDPELHAVAREAMGESWFTEAKTCSAPSSGWENDDDPTACDCASCTEIRQGVDPNIASVGAMLAWGHNTETPEA